MSFPFIAFCRSLALALHSYYGRLSCCQSVSFSCIDKELDISYTSCAYLELTQTIEVKKDDVTFGNFCNLVS